MDKRREGGKRQGSKKRVRRCKEGKKEAVWNKMEERKETNEKERLTRKTEGEMRDGSK